MTSSTDVFNHTFPQVEWYHNHPYWFQFTRSLRSWRMGTNLWSWKWEFMFVRPDIAKRVLGMLQDKSPTETDCHVTADYLAWLWDNFWQVEQSWQERAKHMISSDGVTNDYDHFSSLADAVEGNKWYPFLCRIYDQYGPCHSIIVLWKLSDDTVMWFEHRWQWTDWGFCEVEKAIRARRWENIFCKKI